MSLDQFLLSASTTDLNYPEIRPSLHLNFARTKTLDPRITFTRSSGGSYTGSDGLVKYAGVNEARFDHDPITGESLGLLIEEGRANLLTYSEQFDNAIWNKQNGFSITPNTAIAPDGTLTADTASRVNLGNEFLFQAYGAAGTFTLSCWVRSVTGTATFNMFTYNGIDGTLGFVEHTATTTWQRFSTTAATVTTASNWYPCIPTTSNTQFYIWGAQLEQGSSPTSYIPTVASTKTRAADDASITGTNFLSWYKQIGYTILTNSIVPRYPGDFPRVFEASIPSTVNLDRLNHYHYFNITGFSVLENNNQIAVLNSSLGANTTGGNRVKMVTRYEVNNTSLFINGSFIDNDNVVPNNVTRTFFKIGSTQYSSAYLNSTIANITYYPKALPDAQLQALSR